MARHILVCGADAVGGMLAAAALRVTVGEMSALGAGKFDAVVLHAPQRAPSAGQVEALTKFVRAGGGLVALACGEAVGKSAALGKLLGVAKSGGEGGAVAGLRVSVADGGHAIGQRVQGFAVRDRVVSFVPAAGAHALLSVAVDGGSRAAAIIGPAGMRVVYFDLGYTAEALGNAALGQVVRRAARWAAGEDWSGRTVTVAAIGYGAAFQIAKMHLESCRKSLLTPVAVCDVDPARTAAAKAEQNVETFERVEDLLAKSAAELCIVATPHHLHAPLSMQCLKAGRHVVTEKPYTITIEQATKVIETARRAGKMATVFHNRRWDGDFMAIRDIIASGVIGEVFHVECQYGGYGAPRGDWWRDNKEISGGAFYDWGAHVVDWVLQVMPGKIESVSGSFHKRMWHQVSNEDHTEAFVRFEGGRTAHIEQSSIAAIPKSRWRVLGTLGGLEIKDWDAKAGVRVVSHRGGTRTETVYPIGGGDWDAFYRNVADHLLLGEALAVTPESARKVIAVLSLAEKSSGRGGAPMRVPFEQ